MSGNNMIFFKNEEQEIQSVSKSKWKVLIIDDDESIHAVTKLVLKDFQYMDKEIELHHAYSENQAVQKIRELNNEIALILLDVVMEDSKSGLRIVDFIRNEMKNISTRIILRTGQPGEAPEKKIVLEYDINDYKLKTELSADRLYLTVFTGIRNYRDLCKLEGGKKNLRKIIDSSREIYSNTSYRYCIKEVLKHLRGFIEEEESSNKILGMIATKKEKDYLIEAYVGNGGEYLEGKNIKEFLAKEIQNQIDFEKKEKKVWIFENCLLVYFGNDVGNSYIIYFENINLDGRIDKEELEIFCANASSAIENLFLTEEITKTQKEIIFTLSEIVESKSSETGNHIHRVAEFTRLFTQLYGVSQKESEIIAIASTMHDIGKIIVEDSILKKPGRLTNEEFTVIKKHSSVGYDMLKNSKGKIIEYAAIIAYEHHEKFNGKGYPQGLKGEEINIYARMVSIVDVFDALVSKRVYKEQWSIDEAVEEIQRQRGEQFDPFLVDLFIKNIDQFIQILEKYKD